MGLLKKLKKDLSISAAKERYNKELDKQTEKLKEKGQYHYYVCPQCGSTMKPVMLEVGAVVRKPKARCENCKFTMFVEDAKRELKHPEGEK